MTDLVEYLEPVVPAYRVAEVAQLLESYKVEDLLAMHEEDILEHVNLLQNKMTFEARFLYRYLQAAGIYYCTYLNYFRITIHALSTFTFDRGGPNVECLLPPSFSRSTI